MDALEGSPAHCRVLISGTPVQNDLKELHAMVRGSASRQAAHCETPLHAAMRHRTLRGTAQSARVRTASLRRIVAVATRGCKGDSGGNALGALTPDLSLRLHG